RKAHQADFGHDAKFKAVFALGSRFAGLGEPRRLMACGGEIAVAQAATPAFAQNELLAMHRQVGHEFAWPFGRFLPGGITGATQIIFLRKLAADTAHDWPMA